MKFFLCLFFCAALLSCATMDYDNKIADRSAGVLIQEGESQPEEIFLHEPSSRVIERPVYVPAAEAPPRTTAPGSDSVRASNSQGIIRPQDYSHAAMIYSYNHDWVYEVYTMPLRVTDICLQPMERVVDSPFISDSERWIVGAGISYESNGSPVQHIYVKPSSQGLEATLIVNTDRRVYRVILKSFSNVHMPIVRWTYDNGFPNNYWSSPAESGGSSGNSLAQIDPRFLSFNYRVTRSIFSNPYWLPELVFDDGSKTYIRFPLQVLQREMPAIFENRRDVINYRVSGNLVIIDKLIENLTIRIGKTEVTVTKKRGG